MVRDRLELQAILEDILGSKYVYFQPPPTVKMSYPCIIYKRDDIDAKFADNGPYTHTNRYSVTVVDPDPDSKIPYKIACLPMCLMDRHYTADNLNHDVFTLYF